MTRLLISLSLALFVIPTGLMAADPPPAQAWGDLSGVFVYDGRPEPTKEFEQAGIKIPDESLIVNPKTGALANVFVWLVAPKGEQLAIHPSYTPAVKATIEWKFEEQRYSPHALTLRASQTLKLINQDPVGHTPKLDGRTNKQFSCVLASKEQRALQLPEIEPLPIQAGCMIENLQGWLLVQDHPYMAISDEEGKFTIKNLPVGKATLRFWHEKTGFVSSVILSTGASDIPKGRLSTNIKQGGNDLGKIRFGGKLFE